MMATYKVLVGLDYGKPSKRAEEGDVVSDLPAASLSWLIEQKMIELVDSAPSKIKKVITVEESGE
ncbi:MAG: hypothetical protein EBR94_00690 [Bacteroidetes bacterium]|nr:hypothetical protein [Bacteroidota bacterium]